MDPAIGAHVAYKRDPQLYGQMVVQDVYERHGVRWATCALAVGGSDGFRLDELGFAKDYFVAPDAGTASTAAQ